MKRTEKKRRYSRLVIIVNIVLLCALATATFSWFIFDKNASVHSDGNMSIMAGSGLEIYYKGSWDNYHSIGTNMVTYPDITGDGVHFYCPIVLDNHDMTLDDPTTFTHIDSENKDKYYISIDLKFRTSEAVEVYLSNESAVIGPNIDAENLPDGNQSVSGKHSRDGIAGAVRVAFVENADSTSPSAKIWIPNDKYELIKNEDGKTEFTTNSQEREIFTTVETEVETDRKITTKYPYGYQLNVENKMEDRYWTDKEYCNGKVVVGNNLAKVADSDSTAMINDAVPVLDFTDNEDGRVKEKSLSVRIWIEGTDREADKALLGGQLKYMFKFVSIKKSADAENEANIQNISYDNESRTFSLNEATLDDAGIEYSFNGIDWNDYTGQSIETELVNSNDDIHIRYKETNDKKRSSVKTFSLIASQ